MTKPRKRIYTLSGVRPNENANASRVSRPAGIRPGQQRHVSRGPNNRRSARYSPPRLGVRSRLSRCDGAAGAVDVSASPLGVVVGVDACHNETALGVRIGGRHDDSTGSRTTYLAVPSPPSHWSLGAPSRTATDRGWTSSRDERRSRFEQSSRCFPWFDGRGPIDAACRLRALASNEPCGLRWIGSRGRQSFWSLSVRWGGVERAGS